jgi:hypothetical protein
VAPDGVTPNMLCGTASVLRRVPGTPFKTMQVVNEAHLTHTLKLENRAEAVKGHEIDENRIIEQKVIAAVEKRFRDGAAFVDWRPRPIGNLSDALLYIQLMKPDAAREVSQRMDRMLQSSGYFGLLRRTLDKSHIPTWSLTMAKLWFSGQPTEAMQWVEQCHEFSLMLRRTATRLRRDASRIDPALATRLLVFRSFRDNYLKMAAQMESHCDEVDSFKLLKDRTWLRT